MRNLVKLQATEAAHAPVPLAECTLARAVSVIGDAWVLLILREAVYGIRRFEEMREDLGIPRTVLSERLNRLVGAGLLERVAYREPGRRGRHEYELTERGRALLPALAALREWAEAHLPGGPSALTLRHRCGGRLHARLVCERGHVVEDMNDVELIVLPER
jgi:DNA-binding HxlR family transcriptional regulator